MRKEATRDNCYISAPKNHFEGFRYENHTFNLLESLRRKDNGKVSGRVFFQHFGVIRICSLSVEGCNDKLADPMPINRLNGHLW